MPPWCPGRRATRCPRGRTGHAEHRPVQLGRVDSRELLQSCELALPQRACGQRQQPRHRDDGLADTGSVQLLGETLGHVLSRQHRIEAPGADLVGTGGHPDDAQCSRRPADQFANLLEQRDISCVRVRSRNTTASTRGTPSPGTSSRSVRSETSRDSDEVPGVSMIVALTSSAAGHSTSRSATSVGSRLPRSNVRPAQLFKPRAIGTFDRRPPTWFAVTFGIGRAGTR